MSKLLKEILFNTRLWRATLVNIFLTAVSLLRLSGQPAFTLEQADPELIEKVDAIGTRGKPR